LFSKIKQYEGFGGSVQSTNSEFFKIKNKVVKRQPETNRKNMAMV
jgi:hypothetical protein